MDDLISRQAAMAYPISWEHYDKEHGDRHFICGVESYREYIESLPSAQQWIPCSERLPERNGYYLVTGRKGAVNKRLYQDGYWYGNWAIIAWMPLPEPWRGENNET